MKKVKIVLRVVGFALLGTAVALAILSATSRRPDNLGSVDGRLAPCPAAPNCVCSTDDDAAHHIEPIAYGNEDDPLGRLAAVVGALPGARVVETAGAYLHAEFTSTFFRFVDDVEFLVDAERKVIHCRSASRAGHSDLGVNRRRIEAIRRAFAAKDGTALSGRRAPMNSLNGHQPRDWSEADRAAIREAIRGQIAAFECDEADMAYSFATPAIQAKFETAAKFLHMVEQYFPALYRPREVEFGMVVPEGDAPAQLVRVVGENGTVFVFLYSMEKQPDGSWRINGCRPIQGG